MPVVCGGDCARSFGNEQAMHQHQRALGHCYCYECELAFTSVVTHEEHNSSRHGISCPTASCTDRFPSQNVLAVHQRESGHCYCGLCNRAFGCKADLFQHQLSSPIHQKQNTVYQCNPCSTVFKDKDALTAHLASPFHSTQSIKCPVCEKSFNRHSGMIQHLEDGVCEQSKPTQFGPQQGSPVVSKQKDIDTVLKNIQKACAQAMASSSAPSSGPASAASSS
ncbi:hypothetical protein EV426DRAFT_554349, partial [Tirmania nivea]